MIRKALLSRLGLAAAAAALALGLSEFLARVLAAEPPILRSAIFTDNIAESYAMRFDEVFVRDREAFWRLAPDRRLPDEAWPLRGLISNGQGLREDHEIAPREAADEIRILFLGDSCTFGYGLLHGQTFVERTEHLLRESPGVGPVDCINAGVPGYTLFQGFRLLETRGFAWRPDAVVLSFGWNELAEWDGASDLEHYAELRAATPPGPLARSRVCELAWRAAHPPKRADAVARRPRVVPHEFRSILERVVAAAEREHVDVLLLVWPSSDNLREDWITPLQREQYRFGSARRFGPSDLPALVDGVSVLRAAADQVPLTELYIDPIHAGPRAQLELARALAERLGPWARERKKR